MTQVMFRLAAVTSRMTQVILKLTAGRLNMIGVILSMTAILQDRLGHQLLHHEESETGAVAVFDHQDVRRERRPAALDETPAGIGESRAQASDEDVLIESLLGVDHDDAERRTVAEEIDAVHEDYRADDAGLGLVRARYGLELEIRIHGPAVHLPDVILERLLDGGAGRGQPLLSAGGTGKREEHNHQHDAESLGHLILPWV